jgi:hypothetical protein
MEWDEVVVSALTSYRNAGLESDLCNALQMADSD